jgi:DNA-binding PadR family transcriptional regulator
MHDDIRRLLPLPHLSTLVLLALAAGPAHGWAIIRRIRELTDGETAPSSGSLYLAMLRLEEKGLLEETAAPVPGEDARRRHYRLTTFGRRVLEAESMRLARLVSQAERWHVLDRGRPAEGGA